MHNATLTTQGLQRNAYNATLATQRSVYDARNHATGRHNTTDNLYQRENISARAISAGAQPTPSTRLFLAANGKRNNARGTRHTTFLKPRTHSAINDRHSVAVTAPLTSSFHRRCRNFMRQRLPARFARKILRCRTPSRESTALRICAQLARQREILC
jgi:hypothetical protein